MTPPRWLPWVAALAAIVVTVGLGNWQTRRAIERDAVQARIDAATSAAPMVLKSSADIDAIRSELPRRVRLEGEFVEEATIYLENRIVDGVAGFRVVTPMRIAGAAALVLVERGWVARDTADRSRVAAIAPRGPIVIDGLAVARLPRVLELGNAPDGATRIWQNLDYEQFEKLTGTSVAPFIVEQTSEVADGLKRARPRADAGADRNRAYALQWYALAAGAAALAAFYGLRQRRRSSGSRHAG